MTRRALIPTLALLALALTAGAQPPPRLPSEGDRQLFLSAHAPRGVLPEVPPTPDATQADIDVLSYELSLFLDVPGERIAGSNVIRFVTASGSLSADELVLDLDDEFLDVTRVLRGGVDVPLASVTHAADVLRVPLAPALAQGAPADEVTVFYEGQPQEHQGGFGTLRFETHGEPPVPLIYTLSEPYLGRGWWPCKDLPYDKALVTVHVEAPDNLVVVSNGLEQPSAPGRPGHRITTWTSRYPISTYLVAISATDYVTWQDTYTSRDGLVTMPVPYWVYPESEANARLDFRLTPDMLDFFADIFTEYPFLEEKYGQVAIPLWGAMEHQTITSHGAQLLTGEERYEFIVAHELAHHWWGDLVGPQSFDSIWLNEGFATYSEALWFEGRSDLPTYLAYMAGLDRLPRTGTDFQGTVHAPGAGRLFSDTVYRKGGWVLHMLRWVLGQPSTAPDREALMPVLRAHAAAHPYASASTADFRATADAVSGQSLAWFFDQWLDREGRPQYVVGWTPEPQAGGDVIVRLRARQVQAGGTYRMPVLVRLTFADATTQDVLLDNRDLETDYAIPAATVPVSVGWDPDGWILKTVTPFDIDRDDDGWTDWTDTCPDVPDPAQQDANGNGQGDACEPGLDFDGDGDLNEDDCAPADVQVWDPLPDAAVLRVAKRGADFAFTFTLPDPSPQRAPVADVTHGLLADLRSQRTLDAATCAAPGVAPPEWIDAAAPSAGGDWYLVHGWNGCGTVDRNGDAIGACR